MSFSRTPGLATKSPPDPVHHRLVRIQRTRAIRTRKARELRGWKIVTELLEAGRQSDVPLRLLIAARAAFLREDLNDAVRRLGAVQRCCRGTLEDLDALDVVWIQVTEPIR